MHLCQNWESELIEDILEGRTLRKADNVEFHQSWLFNKVSSMRYKWYFRKVSFLVGGLDHPVGFRYPRFMRCIVILARASLEWRRTGYRKRRKQSALLVEMTRSRHVPRKRALIPLDTLPRERDFRVCDIVEKLASHRAFSLSRCIIIKSTKYM